MTETMTIGSLQCELHRKAIKNLHIAVLPPHGRVRVSAPEAMRDTAISAAVASRLVWIKRQQQKFLDQPRQSGRQMVGGEGHFLWGRSYRLKIVFTEGRAKVEAGKQYITLFVKADSTQQERMRLLENFYRRTLKQEISRILPRWQEKIAAPAAWGIKRMKTKWGSCNTESRRIWLNSELVKKPHDCLEYILVHELVHLLERHHNERFQTLMDTHLPNWRHTRDSLNGSVLSEEKWI